MRADDPFDALDLIEWSALTHAYGPAADTPDLLRRLASEDADIAAEAEYDLADSIVHQGSVYPATVAAVPFLARAAAAGIRTEGVLDLLWLIAASADTHALEPALEHAPEPADAARRAVADQGELLVPLVAAPDAGVRAASAWVLATTRDAGRFTAVLAERWQAETDADVRAVLLHALHVLDPETAKTFAGQALAAEQPPHVRMIATYVLAEGGAPWDAEMDGVAARWLADPPATHGRPWRLQFQDLVKVVLRAHGAAAAVALITPALRVGTVVPDEVRLRAVDSAQLLIRRSRRATPLLLPLLAPWVGVAEDGTVGRVSDRVLDVLRLIGPSAAPYATESVFAVADRASQGRDADFALSMLLEWGVPAAADVLARDLPDRPLALEAAAKAFSRYPSRFPFHSGLFDAITSRMRALSSPNRDEHRDRDRAKDKDKDKADRHVLVASMQAHNEPIFLRELLTAWGYQDIDGIAVGRARAGDDTLEAVESGLTQTGSVLARAAEAAAEMSDHRDRLLPLLTEALARMAAPSTTVPALAARISVAKALWRLGAAPEAGIEVYSEALTWSDRPHQVSTWTVIDAIKAATELGAAGASLVPTLVRLLDAPDYCAASAEALRAMEPAVFDSPAGQRRLARKLVAAINAGSFFMHQRPPVDALARLAPEAITGDVRETLVELASRDERLVRAGTAVSLVREDEELRGLIEDVLMRARTEPSPDHGLVGGGGGGGDGADSGRIGSATDC